MTERYCMGCKGWYDPKEPMCPFCGTEAPKFNKWLRTAQLNNHLHGEIARAKQQRG